MPYEKMDSIKKHVSSYRFFTLPIVCLCLSLMTLPQTSCAPATPKPTQNITLTVPEGTQNHGNPNLLCTPTRWTDVVIFFFANYVAHAATTKSLPGEPALATLRLHMTALFFPLAGVLRGVKAVGQLAVLSDTPLGTAAWAEALCVVIRTREWQPKSGDVACVSEFLFPKRTSSGAQLRIDMEEAFRWPHFCIKANDRSFLPANNSIAEFNGRKVHGICCLPHGYALAVLPPGARITELCKDGRDGVDATYVSSWNKRLKDAFKTLAICYLACLVHIKDVIPFTAPKSKDDPSKPDTSPTIKLSSNFYLPKCVIAVVQTLYASATLYQSRGDQIEHYVYAAFGLTVAPYLLMSIVNLLSTMLTPVYSCLYLVKSEIMDEAARREGAKFEGMVATLTSDARRERHYVEFTIDEHERIFIRNPRESISERGLHDATDVTQRQLLSEYAVLPQDSRKSQVKERAQSLFRVVISESPGFSDELLSPSILDRAFGVAGLIIGLSPIAIVGVVSHFNAGHSTIAQRVWTMTWLAFGWYIGLAVHSDRNMGEDVFVIMFYASPAIGGFVVVAQMLMSYGRCIEIAEAHI